jgi:hypothetical protein
MQLQETLGETTGGQKKLSDIIARKANDRSI